MIQPDKWFDSLPRALDAVEAAPKRGGAPVPPVAIIAQRMMPVRIDQAGV